MRSRYRPLEILNLTVLVILLALAVAYGLTGRLAGWPWLAATYTCLLGIVLLAGFIARAPPPLPRPLRLLVDFYPLAVIPVVFESLGALIPAVNSAVRDPWLIRVDHALLGVHPTVWLQRCVAWPLTDLLYMSYTSYYFLVPLVAMGLWRKSDDLARKFIFIISLTFFVSYAGYFVVPALGPRTALAQLHTLKLEQTLISRTICRTLEDAETTKQDAFPSGHTMIAAVSVYFALRYTRRLGLILAPVATLLVIATVYCRYHYVSDVLAGLLLAALMPWLGARLYAWLAIRRQRG